MLRFSFAILLCMLSSVHAFHNNLGILSSSRPLLNREITSPSRIDFVPNGPARRTSIRTNKTSLMLDVFGLGPPEVAIIMIAAFFLYGGDGLKEKVTGVKVAGKGEGIREERAERIKNMIKSATKVRKTRSWKRVNALIETEDPMTLRRLEELNIEEEL